MDAPLTGATQLVGQSDRDAVQSIVSYWNAQGGIKGKEVVVDVLDNASNPSQAVQNIQRFTGDSKYVGILGSGNAAAAVATGPLASQAGIPFIALSPPTDLIEPPQPYVYVLTATSRLYAYNEAAYLRKLGIKKVWLMGDNGGFGRDGPTQVQKLASKYGLQILDTTIFSPASTDFSAELTKVKDSGAQALWLWTATPAGADDRQAVQAAPAAAAARPDRGEPLRELPPGDLRRRRRRDHQLVRRHRVGVPAEEEPVWAPVRTQAALLQKMLGRPVSNFDADTAVALWAYKAAIEKGGFTRSAINTALETKISGLVTPGGRIRLSKTNHQGVQLPSMWAGKIQSCKAKPLFGTAFG